VVEVDHRVDVVVVETEIVPASTARKVNGRSCKGACK